MRFHVSARKSKIRAKLIECRNSENRKLRHFHASHSVRCGAQAEWTEWTLFMWPFPFSPHLGTLLSLQASRYLLPRSCFSYFSSFEAGRPIHHPAIYSQYAGIHVFVVSNVFFFLLHCGSVPTPSSQCGVG